MVDHPVHWISKFEQNAMRSGRQALDDQRLAARIYPMPGPVVHGDVEMSDPRRDIDRTGTERRHDSKVFGPMLNDDQTAGEKSAKGASTMIFAGGSFASGMTAAGAHP